MRALFIPGATVRRVAALLALTSLLAACASTAPTAPDAAPSAVAPAAPITDAAVAGQILLPPGSTLPIGARLQLVLADRFPDALDTPPLAASDNVVEGAPPLRFQLPFARAAVRDISVYRLDVAIFDGNGRLAFISDGEHPVNLGVEAEPTRIELMAVAEGQQQRLRFDCGGLLAEVTIADPDLRLQLPDGPHALRRAHAASGIRYIGAGAEFWSKGREARIQVGERSLNCVLGAP